MLFTFFSILTTSEEASIALSSSIFAVVHSPPRCPAILSRKGTVLKGAQLDVKVIICEKKT